MTTGGGGDEERALAEKSGLLDDYAAWAEGAAPAVDARLADVALDWKLSYGDGELTTWTTADLEEFVLGWCPRKLTMPAEDAEPFLEAVGTFFLFLAARGRLGSRSSGPQQLLSWCRRHTRQFAGKMKDPAHFGMAKSLFAGVGGLDPDIEHTPESVRELMEQIQGMSPEELDGVLSGGGESPVLGPVSMPTDDERAASASAAPVLERMRRLHEYCAAPGRTLTQKGNVRLADARELVGLLETGDPTEPRYGSLRSAEELPVLDWLVQIGLETRVVRRHRGRLVAVAAWGRLGPVEAWDRVVDAGVAAGLTGPSMGDGFFGQAHDMVEGALVQVLADLVDGCAAGEDIEIDETVDAVTDVVGEAFGGWRTLADSMASSRVRRQFDRLELLGVLTQDGVERSVDEDGIAVVEGGRARLTPAGVAASVRLLEAQGITVTTRQDVVEGTAEALLDLGATLDPEAWLDGAAAWVSARESRAAAVEIGDALVAGERAALEVLGVLSHVESLLGEHAAVAVERLLDGRWDGVAAMWLADHGEPRPLEARPERGTHGFVDVVAVVLDTDGPDAMLDALHGGDASTDPRPVLEQMWRLDHERVAEVLEVIGRGHQDKTVAKHARKMLAKHRSRAPGRG